MTLNHNENLNKLKQLRKDKVIRDIEKVDEELVKMLKKCKHLQKLLKKLLIGYLLMLKGGNQLKSVKLEIERINSKETNLNTNNKM